METKELSKCLTVSDVTVTTVKPLPKKVNRQFKEIHPTSLDIFLKAILCPYLFAYKTAGKEGNDTGGPLELIRRMRNSLQQVLDVFYPFAGRWIMSSKEFENDSQPHLQCNDAGVPFIEAYVNEDLDNVLPTGEGVSLTTLQVPHVTALFEKGFEALGVKFTDWDVDDAVPRGGLPPLVIQVTRFKCGGVVLATTYSHMLVDENAFFDFMKAWSDFALAGQTPITPDFDRTKGEMYKPHPVLPLKKNQPGFKRSKGGLKVPRRLFDVIKVWSGLALTRRTAISPDFDRAEGEMDVPDAALPKNTTGFKRSKEALQFPKRVFEVDKSVVEAMKLEVERETNGTKHVSTEDCISAHIWKSISRDELKTSARERVLGLGVVEGRTKFFNPPLSQQWFGNMMQPSLYPNLSARELEAMPTSSVALMIQEDPQPAWFSHQRRAPLLALMKDQDNLMWTNISLRGLPSYKIDFGYGNLVFACPATAHRFLPHKLGRVVIYPPVPGHAKSSSTVHFEINPRLTDTLCIDRDFLSLFLDT